MKRRDFLVGAAALAASPALPVGPVGAGEWWTPELLSDAGMMLATNAEAVTGVESVAFAGSIVLNSRNVLYSMDMGKNMYEKLTKT